MIGLYWWINSICRNLNYFIKRYCGHNCWGYLYAKRSCNPALACSACTSARMSVFTLACAMYSRVCRVEAWHFPCPRVGEVYAVYALCNVRHVLMWPMYISVHTYRNMVDAIRGHFTIMYTPRCVMRVLCNSTSTYPWFKNIIYSMADQRAVALHYSAIRL